MFGLGNQVHIKVNSYTYPASTDLNTTVIEICSLFQKGNNHCQVSIAQFLFVLSIDVVLHLLSHFNSSTLFQTHSQSLKKGIIKSLIGSFCMLFIYL